MAEFQAIAVSPTRRQCSSSPRRSELAAGNPRAAVLPADYLVPTASFTQEMDQP